MNSTFKKALATIAMLSLLSGFALNVNAAAQTSTSVFDGSNTITVTVPGVAVFTSDVLTALNVTDQDGTSLTNVDVADVTENGDTTFTVDTTNHGVLATGIYSVSFITTAWEFGSSIFVVGAANEIQVTANVLPILSMKVTGSAVFGDLVAGNIATATTTAITINTNASAGYQLSVANSTNGLNKGSNPEDKIAPVTANTDLSAAYGYGIQAVIAAGSAGSAGGASATGVVGGDYNYSNDTVSPMTNVGTSLSSAPGAVIDQITTVTYKAKIDALQETGNYVDTVTYSVTGAF